MYNLRIRTLAQQDVQEIIDYYDSINFRLTERFLKKLYFQIDKNDIDILAILHTSIWKER